jgi:hypothetical protein
MTASTPEAGHIGATRRPDRSRALRIEIDYTAKKKSLGSVLEPALRGIANAYLSDDLGGSARLFALATWRWPTPSSLPGTASGTGISGGRYGGALVRDA